MNAEQLIILEAQEASACLRLESAREKCADDPTLRALLLAWAASAGAVNKERQRMESENDFTP